MEQSRDREEKREGGGSQRANKQIQEGGRGVLTEGMSKRWRMEIGLDRERRREGGGLQFYPASSAPARGNKRVSHMNGSVLFEDPHLFKEQSHAVIIHAAQALTHSQVAQPTFTLSHEHVSFTSSHLA